MGSKPKLGDVRYRKNKSSFDVYFVYVYYRNAWRFRDAVKGRKNAYRSAKAWRTFMRDIIREARETKDGK